MSQIKSFTVEEANAVLQEIKPLMSDLIETKARMMVQQREMSELLGNLYLDVGGPALNDLVEDFNSIEHLIDKIQEYGCVVKDVNVGLLDFPAQIDGRQVFLCWRYGEEEIAYYHGIHEGFNGRSPIE